MTPLRVLVAGLLCAGGLALAPAAQAGADGFTVERRLQPGASGPNRVALDEELLARAKPVRYADTAPGAPPVAGLEDLRFFDAGGREVPYLLMLPRAARERSLDGAVLAILPTKNESGFEVDLGAVENVDRLTLEGLPSPLLKRFRLEGSGDRRRWVALIPEGTVFDLPAEGLRLLDAEFSAGPYRFLRWTWNDATSGRVRPPTSARVRLLERSEPPPATTVRLAVERRPSEPRVSRFHLRLPGRDLPIDALVLEVAPGDLLRQATVTEPRFATRGVEPAPLGEAVLRRSSHAGQVAAALAIPIVRPRESGLDLTVQDGDSGPLRLDGAVARLRPLPWIYFESPDGAEIVARFGKPSAMAPRYDLEASRGAAASAIAATATWGASRVENASPSAASALAPPMGGTLATGAFRFERVLAATGDGLLQLPLDAAVLAHAHGLADLRLVTDDGTQVPFLLERRAEPLEIRLAIDSARRADGSAGTGGPTEGTVSRYTILLPFAGLPASRLAIATSSRLFAREVVLQAAVVDAATGGERWNVVAHLAWRHTDPELEAPELAIDLPALAGDRLRVEVEEGDNSPLPLSGARLLLPSWRLRFFGTGTPLRLLYGDSRLAPPRYDLELLAPRLVGVEGRELVLPDERPLAAGNTPMRSGRWFWIGLGGAVLVLLALLARLLRGAPPAAANS
ncbi:MAG: DUF3999 family protein [Thermoanaerobaculia bacterium]|nr:DUF3999 family protein [Thermoanaerobaculia bacterium]MBP9823395.1 DUF3999 family protein [Thermoanaerobaculia bacterium]